MAVTVGRVTGLWRYPVKSMLGETLEEVEVAERGLFGDRSYALVDEESGKIASAKSPRKFARLFEFRATLGPAADGGVLPPARITFPDGTELDSGDERLVRMLSEEFGREVSFQGLPEGGSVSAYEYDQAEEDRGEGPTGEGNVSEMEMPASTFFDAGAVHLLGTATLRELEASHPEGSFEIRRFRPNLVLDIEEGFAEERWIEQTLAVGPEVRLHVTGPCPRCVMVNLSQPDLSKDSQILRTVAVRNAGNAGVYATVTRPGRIGVGDEVTVD